MGTALDHRWPQNLLRSIFEGGSAMSANGPGSGESMFGPAGRSGRGVALGGFTGGGVEPLEPTPGPYSSASWILPWGTSDFCLWFLCMPRAAPSAIAGI